MEKISCLNCKYSSHKCKDHLATSGWIFYCEYYEEMFDLIGACDHYQKRSSNNE